MTDDEMGQRFLADASPDWLKPPRRCETNEVEGWLGECPACGAANGEACRRKLQIGDRVPIKRKPLSLRPAFTGAGAPSFKPARKGKK